MMRIKLTNNFHNTVTHVYTKDGWLTRRQVRRAWNKLCGFAGCTCGDDTGSSPSVVVDVRADRSIRIIDRERQLGN